jgi:hypothetical protein
MREAGAPRFAEEHGFAEEQSFAAWMRAVVLLPLLVLGGTAAALWASGPPAAAGIFTILALGAFALAWPAFALRLQTRVDATHLRLRIEPMSLRVPFLPPRVKDVALADILRAESRSYGALKDRDYWGRHFWGLGSNRRGDRLLYVMRGGALSGRGVEVELRGGERLIVGSARPGELAGALGHGGGASGGAPNRSPSR